MKDFIIPIFYIVTGFYFMLYRWGKHDQMLFGDVIMYFMLWPFCLLLEIVNLPYRLERIREDQTKIWRKK